MSGYADEARQRNLDYLRETEGFRPAEELLNDDRGTPTGGGDRAGGRTPRGRLRRAIGRLEVREAVESPTEGSGIDLAGERLDADDVEDLVGELVTWLAEHGRTVRLP